MRAQCARWARHICRIIAFYIYQVLLGRGNTQGVLGHWVRRKSLFCVEGLARAEFFRVRVKADTAASYGLWQEVDMRQGLNEK
jgi:hypothetical protein